MAEFTYYEILDVAPTATHQEIKDAYRRAVRSAHPDAGGTAGMFRLVSQAYETLRDPEARSAYDARLNTGGEGTPNTPSPPNGTPSSQPPEPEWGTEVDWNGQPNHHPRTEHWHAAPEADTEGSWQVNDPRWTGAEPGVVDNGTPRLLDRWTFGRHGALTLAGLIVTELVIFGLFSYVLFSRTDVIRPDAAESDVANWFFVHTPITQVTVVIYTISLILALTGAPQMLLAAHTSALLALIVWPFAYWSPATAGERLTYVGGTLLWVLYNVLIVVITGMLARRSDVVDLQD